MKKTGILFMTLVLAFGLFACGKKTDKETDNSGEDYPSVPDPTPGVTVPESDNPTPPKTPIEPSVPVEPNTPLPSVEREIEVDYDNLTIYVPAERNLRVAQFTDLHFSKESAGGYSNDKEQRTINFMNQVVTETDPDMIILSGDNIFGKSANNGMSGVTNLKRLISIMDSLKKPWMFVYGNHDSEELTAGSSKKDLHEYLLSCDSPYLIYGNEYSEPNNDDYRDVRYGVYSVKIKDLDSKELKGAYIAFDNGYYDTRISSYNSISEGQINWYKNKVSELQTEYKGEGVVPTIVISHIQLPEVYNAYVSAYVKENPQDSAFAKKYADGIFASGEHEFVVYQDVSKISGDSDWVEMIKVGAPLTNKTNLYDVMVELGSTKAVFNGHCHNYYFQVKSNGIVFAFGTQTGFAPAESINWDPRMGNVYNFDSNLNLVDTTFVNEDESKILGKGLAVKYMDSSNGDSLFLQESADANGNYVYTVTMKKQWSRIKLFFNGEVINVSGAGAYTFTGDYSTSSGSKELYSEAGQPILYYSLKEEAQYKITVNPTNKTVNIDLLGDEDLNQGCTIVTRYNGTQDLKAVSTSLKEVGGLYTMEITFAKKWGYVSIMYNGVYLDPTNATFTGDIGAYGSTALYFDGDAPAHQLNCCQANATYVITYNPTTNTVNVQYKG